MSRKKVEEINLSTIEKTFKAMQSDRASVGLALLDEVLFMKKTLAKMRKDIEESSLVAEYSNYKRSNPIIAGYNAMINNYSKLTRQLADLLPKEDEYRNIPSIDDIDLEEILNEEY